MKRSTTTTGMAKQLASPEMLLGLSVALTGLLEGFLTHDSSWIESTTAMKLRSRHRDSEKE